MLNLSDALNAVSEVARTERSKYHLTLGALIEALRQVVDKTKLVEIQGEKASPALPHSYRGYYSDLAFEVSNMLLNMSVGKFLAQLENDVFGHTFTGYKGGDYVMTGETPLWIARYGEASQVAVVGYMELEDGFTLLTKKIDD